ncbi:Phosphotyrosyl phosphatase activator [Piedraia hortae CBS 480.64]|uniref:Serine/threonine-protein phosphatase 2A activator n=1 Tax=Piedraia hortae CBS 480.64 TaxID=1314780 RepID=A0A6A7BT79_9PEZI|nr:Phosphotyrosyl phosphatase activator [Piedraia hortae CBS 480.64]
MAAEVRALHKPKAHLKLERLPGGKDFHFEKPLKKINDAEGLNFFLSSIAHRDLMIWILQLNRSMFPTRTANRGFVPSELTSPPKYSDAVTHVRALLNELSALIEQAPPSTRPRRFGNVAFQDWYKLAEEASVDLLRKHLPGLLGQYTDEETLIQELSCYLLGSFGSAQRLDYGTGHELSFIAFLASLWKLHVFEDGEERAIVVGNIQPYLELVRKLVMTYTLEPAGSHGVWGLDDHFFAPYIFGSAQFGPAIDPDSQTPTPTEGSIPSAPPASAVTDKKVVAEQKEDNMYFSAIQFIYDVKRGPFWEHSPVLYDISGISDGWAKINKGMLKMYAAEVLGKFPVVQHFPFGGIFKWRVEPHAAGTSDMSQQPKQPKSMDVPPGPINPLGPTTTAAPWAGTAAPWASANGAASISQMQASTGVPSARVPGNLGTRRPR